MVRVELNVLTEEGMFDTVNKHFNSGSLGSKGWSHHHISISSLHVHWFGSKGGREEKLKGKFSFGNERSLNMFVSVNILILFASKCEQNMFCVYLFELFLEFRLDPKFNLFWHSFQHFQGSKHLYIYLSYDEIGERFLGSVSDFRERKSIKKAIFLSWNSREHDQMLSYLSFILFSCPDWKRGKGIKLKRRGRKEKRGKLKETFFTEGSCMFGVSEWMDGKKKSMIEVCDSISCLGAKCNWIYNLNFNINGFGIASSPFLCHCLFCCGFTKSWEKRGKELLLVFYGKNPEEDRGSEVLEPGK